MRNLLSPTEFRFGLHHSGILRCLGW